MSAISSYINSLSPSGYWKFDETSGTSAADSGPNGLTGTYNGTYTLGSSPLNSNPDGTEYGAYLSGTAFVQVSHHSSLDISSAFTFFGQTIEQRWFAGAHGDLGGAYPERDLADVALAWLQRHSMEKGLAIETRLVPLQPNALSPIHDSFSECFGRIRKWFHSRFYRPVMQTGTNTEVLDSSVHTRLIHTPHYRPKNEGLKSVLHFE